MPPEVCAHCSVQVYWVSVLRQLQELRVCLKKGGEDAQDLHHCSVPRSSSTTPSRVPNGASKASASPEKGRSKLSELEICQELCGTGTVPHSSSAPPSRVPKGASKASASPEKGRTKLSELEICQELCFTGTAPALPDSVSDEEERFWGGGADSDDEAELAGMAPPERADVAEQSGESPDMLTGQDHSSGPFKLCLEDDPFVSVSDIQTEVMLKTPSIPCGPQVWEQSWRSPVDVLLRLRDALLQLFSKLGVPNSRDKRLADETLQCVLTELRGLASSPQKLRTAAEEQQFELDRLDHFMAWLTHDAVGGSMLKKVGGHVMRDVLAGASAIMSTIDTVPTLFGVLEKCKSMVGGSIKTVIIDEAGCVPEYELPILLAFSPVVNLILIGDHHQLPCFSKIDLRSQEKLDIKNHSR
ncbi:hypothetical protein DUNSADRAFT_8310 [Dunaliella salina]|uniref:DNA2/NAM7 helicase helicase domain-containing protein n=1 Tax=Dunaliella salina TaxID=3046 RepID=A0ABQ7H5W3_DUNSA|nr:hypothetical protein DUNSADRAFT_8310 [Dunaliella salina]|eukprot:KAF5842247.1 hypothetical protein DUNSADRAFT_8310 [Dunaliella salina]